MCSLRGHSRVVLDPCSGLLASGSSCCELSSVSLGIGWSLLLGFLLSLTSCALHFSPCSHPVPICCCPWGLGLASQMCRQDLELKQKPASFWPEEGKKSNYAAVTNQSLGTEVCLCGLTKPRAVGTWLYRLSLGIASQQNLDSCARLSSQF